MTNIPRTISQAVTSIRRAIAYNSDYSNEEKVRIIIEAIWTAANTQHDFNPHASIDVRNYAAQAIVATKGLNIDYETALQQVNTVFNAKKTEVKVQPDMHLANIITNAGIQGKAR